MRKTEEAAEGAVREAARMRSELDALGRPVQQYAAAGSQQRLASVSERLAQARDKLATQEAQLQVRCLSVPAPGQPPAGSHRTALVYLTSGLCCALLAGSAKHCTQGAMLWQPGSWAPVSSSAKPVGTGRMPSGLL